MKIVFTQKSSFHLVSKSTVSLKVKVKLVLRLYQANIVCEMFLLCWQISPFFLIKMFFDKQNMVNNALH